MMSCCLTKRELVASLNSIDHPAQAAIGVIVEGVAEVECVPILIRRCLQSLNRNDIAVRKPFRVKRNAVLKDGEIERSSRQLLADRENIRCVLILLDSDDDCPAELAPTVKRRCLDATQLPCAVVFAKREYESWLLGSIDSIRGKYGVNVTASPPAEPESIRDAKGTLSSLMSSRYVPTADQASLTAVFDLRAARQRCPSLDKFLRDIESLIAIFPIE